MYLGDHGVVGCICKLVDDHGVVGCICKLVGDHGVVGCICKLVDDHGVVGCICKLAIKWLTVIIKYSCISSVGAQLNRAGVWWKAKISIENLFIFFRVIIYDWHRHSKI